MIPAPNTERLPRGGSDTWDQEQAGTVLRDDVFAPAAPIGGFRSLALLGLGIAALSGLPDINASAALADQSDATSSSASAPVAASSSLGDRNDDLGSAAAIAAAATSALADRNDAMAAAAGAQAAASSSLADQPNSLTSAATIAAAASSSPSDQPDSLGAASSAPVAASAAPQDQPDSLGSSSSAPTAASSSLQDQPDALTSSAGAPSVEASAGLLDAPDALASTSSAAVAAAASAQDTADSLSATVLAPIGASASLGDAQDATSGQVLVPIGAAASLGDGANISDGSVVTVSGAGFRSIALLPINMGGGGPNIASASLFDSAAVSSSSVTLRPIGFRSLSGLPLSQGAYLGPTTLISGSLLDAPAALTSSAGPGVLLTSINGTVAYRITATADLEVGDRIELLSAVGGPMSDITINQDGTFILAPGSTVTAFDVRVWSISEQVWGSSATQSLDLTATISLREQADMIAAILSQGVTASAAIFEANAFLGSAAALANSLSGSLGDSPDKMNSSGSAIAYTVMGVSMEDSPFTTGSLTALSVGGAAALFESQNLLQASGTFTSVVAMTGFASLEDASDLLTSAASVRNAPTSLRTVTMPAQVWIRTAAYETRLTDATAILQLLTLN